MQQFLVDAICISLLMFLIKAVNQGVTDQVIIQAVTIGLIAAIVLATIRQFRSGSND